ncbi:unnamed protein product [Linum trigynum]|uniref:CCHC-type domain-containing protein n=1 Tax=Linum trigynum TaxID=586398 RepID=A0AAV2FRT4_9ROSI
MSSGESISSMYKRFNDMINRLKGIGKLFETKDLVRKIFRCLPREWLPKRTAIEEAKDLNTLSIERLVGSLLSHEEVIIQMNKDDHRRRKVIAFKAQEYDSDSEADMGEEFEKEFALVSRNFHRMLKMKKDFKAKRAYHDSRHFNSQFPEPRKDREEIERIPTKTNERYVSYRPYLDKSTPRSYDRSSDGRERFKIDKEDHRSSNEKDLTVCYKCGNTGHIRSKCPTGSKAKEKALAASWSDLSSEEEHEIKDLAYMAFATNSEHISILKQQ